MADGGPQVGEQAEILAQAQQPGLGPHLVGHVGPLRAADGAEHHGVRGAGPVHVGIADGGAMRVVGAAADEARPRLEARDPGLAEPGQHLLDFGHHLGADAVTREKEETMGRHRVLARSWVGSGHT